MKSIILFWVINDSVIANKTNCTSANIEKNYFKERATDPTEHQIVKYFQIYSIQVFCPIRLKIAIKYIVIYWEKKFSYLICKNIFINFIFFFRWEKYFFNCNFLMQLDKMLNWINLNLEYWIERKKVRGLKLISIKIR